MGLKDKLVFKKYLKKAKKGIAMYQCNVGACYCSGNGVKQDFEQAIFWFKQAINQNYPNAYYNLGNCYERGRGVPVDLEKALQLYKQAEALGCAFASEAIVRISSKADSHGTSIKDLYEMGKSLYESGNKKTGNEKYKDIDNALVYLKKSAEAGNALAMNLLGYIYCYEEYYVDYGISCEWSLKAAKQDNIDALFRMGQFYEKGLGVAQNLTEAVKWYEKAASLGHKDAKNAAERLKSVLAPKPVVKPTPAPAPKPVAKPTPTPAVKPASVSTVKPASPAPKPVAKSAPSSTVEAKSAPNPKQSKPSAPTSQPKSGSALSANEYLQKMKTAGYNYAETFNLRFKFAEIMLCHYMLSLDLFCTSVSLLHGGKSTVLWHVDLSTGNFTERVEDCLFKYNNDPEKSYRKKDEVISSCYTLFSDQKEYQAEFIKWAQQAAKYKNWFKPEWLMEQIWRIYDVQDDLCGRITGWLARNIGLGFSEAGTYINEWTGEFRPGRWMPHCLDPKLKELFAAYRAEYNKIQRDNDWVLRFADEDLEKSKKQLESAVKDYVNVVGEEASKPARLALKAELSKRLGSK